ncbi:hypothetical protein M2333_001481 [Sphingobium sp. B11D3B]|uniref:hypothetical protein n=1 Tax=Sphingobium sp. B11D3B TaxID=2940575 RepID=UPI002227ADA8|nr:hypothetical protein [Sphingobium sp. B11D3B]MCW2388435.1 hypothetical protein [Sphingobium sp. B11D3B]
MNENGLAQAQERFERMENAVEIIVSDAPLKQRETAWLDLVSAFGRVYSKLEQAAKDSSEAAKWFQAKKMERRTDPLLQYMHHARNADEHTLISPAGGVDVAVQATVSGEGGTLGIGYGPNGRPFLICEGMAHPKIYEHEVLLNAAIDRGVTYRPPETHLGKEIEDYTPREVAPLVVTYASQMLDEAKSLVS